MPYWRRRPLEQVNLSDLLHALQSTKLANRGVIFMMPPKQGPASKAKKTTPPTAPKAKGKKSAIPTVQLSKVTKNRASQKVISKQ